MTPDELLELLNRADPDCRATKDLKKIFGGYFGAWLEEQRRRSGGLMADISRDELDVGRREAARKMLASRSMEGMKSAQRAQLGQAKGLGKVNAGKTFDAETRQEHGRKLWLAQPGISGELLRRAYEQDGCSVSVRTAQNDLRKYKGSRN